MTEDPTRPPGAERPPVLVVVEARGDGLAPGALPRVVMARRLGSPVEVVVDVPPGDAASRLLRGAGVSVVHSPAPGGELGGWEELADAVAARVRRGGACAVVVGSSPLGRDVAGRLSALLDVAAVVDVTGVTVEDGATVVSSVLGGTVDVTTACGPGRPLVLVVPASVPSAGESGAGPRAEPAGDLPLERVTLSAPAPAPASRRARIAHRDAAPAVAGPALEEARVVFCAGAGLRRAAVMDRLVEAAALVGAAVGATRPVIDAGWALPHQLVGQSGASVAADVCVCWGVSGAPQHLAGLRAARHLVAVNRDPNAPIFRYADVGVVGDAGVVLDQLLAELRFRATWGGGSRPQDAGESGTAPDSPAAD